jgi:hypothetical protein
MWRKPKAAMICESSEGESGMMPSIAAGRPATPSGGETSAAVGGPNPGPRGDAPELRGSADRGVVATRGWASEPEAGPPARRTSSAAASDGSSSSRRVKVYQYAAGFMHAKLVRTDDRWSSIGSANFDNRSLLLNFVRNALIESGRWHGIWKRRSGRTSKSRFASTGASSSRPFVGRVVENACRLVSPIL